MPPSPAHPRPPTLSRLLRDASGATAVEFGLVALPFFALLGATIQVAFIIWAQQNFDYAFQQAVRQLFTGQFQTTVSQGSDDAVVLATLQSKMCNNATAPRVVIFNCAAVKIDVSIGTTFALSSPPTAINPNTKDWNASFGTNYTCPGPSAIVIATAAVKFPVVFGLWNAALSDFADGSQLLQSTAVFRTEPYTTNTGAPPC